MLLTWALHDAGLPRRGDTGDGGGAVKVDAQAYGGGKPCLWHEADQLIATVTISAQAWQRVTAAAGRGLRGRGPRRRLQGDGLRLRGDDEDEIPEADLEQACLGLAACYLIRAWDRYEERTGERLCDEDRITDAAAERLGDGG